MKCFKCLEYFLFNVFLAVIVFSLTRAWGKGAPWYAIPNVWIAAVYFTGLPHSFFDHVKQMKKDDWTPPPTDRAGS